jgi:hypothetical protein
VPNRSQGQPVTISTTVSVTDPVTGVTTLTDPGTILLRVRKPDLTFLADFTGPVHPSTGKYYVNLSSTDLAALGQYRWSWITTGTAAGVSPRAGIINVVDPFAPAHISVEDAKARLNVSATDDEIQDMIDSSVQEQEQRVGPVAPRAVTGLVVYPSSGVLLLPATVVSLTSLTPAGGTALDLGSLDLSKLSSGIVRPGTLSAFWASSYTAVFVAGRNPVPQDLVEAALLRVQASYETQRGPAGLPLAAEQESGFGSSYPLLLRARDKEAPYVLPAVA